MKFLERFWFGCGHCHEGHGCPVAEHADPETGQVNMHIEGLSIPVAVLLVFVLPPAMAILGAHLVNRWYSELSGSALDWAQCGGAVAGFFFGVVLAQLTVWILRRFASASGDAQ